MTIFNGKKFSEGLLVNLRIQAKLQSVKPQLAILLVGENKASSIYAKLKEKAAKKVGFEARVYHFSEAAYVKDIANKINKLNADKDIDGIMLQLPLPDRIKDKTDYLVGLIEKQKDVDGLQENSKFTPATVKAVLKIADMCMASNFLNENSKVAIVGAKGEVGKRLISSIRFKNIIKLDIEDSLDKLVKADCIISATGKADLIKYKHLKSNVVLIDIGAPKAEFDKECYKKALFYTPVPGGVGPLTVYCLVENLFEASMLRLKGV